MNTTLNDESAVRRLKFLAGVLAAGLLFDVTACSTTHQVRNVTESGFLKDYSQLQEGRHGEAKLIYIDVAANWSKYTKIYIAPVELWKSDDPYSKLGRLDRADHQMLVNYLHTVLNNSLSKDFQMVDHAGPGVLVVRAAITEAKESRPVSDLVSSVLPIGLAVSYTKRIMFGTGLAVGECQVEAEFLDGQTGQRVAAVVDRRAGTKALRTKFDGSFGDVKLCMDYWAERLNERLMELRTAQNNTDLL
jgi:hypothetical protein